MPTMTQDTHDQIAINKRNIVSLNTPKAHVKIEGLVPTLTLGMEAGGPKRTDIIFKDDESGKVRALIKYSQIDADNSDLFIETRSESGHIQNMLILKANGQIENPTAGETVNSFDSLLTARMIEAPMKIKADLDYVNNAMINTFTGVGLPDPSMGKSGDQYHRYTSMTPTTIASGYSYDDSSQVGFYLFKDMGNALQEIFVETPYNQRKVYITYGSDGLPHMEDLVLNIDGTDVPLQIDFQNATGIIGKYTSTYDSLMASVRSNTQFEMKVSILTGKNEDYTNFSGEWMYTPIFNHTYEFVKFSGGTQNPMIIMDDTNWTTVLDKDLGHKEQGTYQYVQSITFEMSIASRNAIFRTSLDGGAHWETRQKKVLDKSDAEDAETLFPLETPPGGIPVHLMMQAKVESGSGATLKIHWASQVLERKK